MNNAHEYNPVTQNCTCGEITRNDADKTWTYLAGEDPARSEEMSRLWHIGHRAQLGLGYEYQQVDSDKLCPACIMKNRPHVEYEMVSGSTRVGLCEFSAREYGIIWLQMHKVLVPEPLQPTCDCCTKIMKKISD